MDFHEIWEFTLMPEEASTHKNEKTHTSNVFVTRDLDLLDLKINGFPGLIVEHFCVKFGDPSCIDF